MTDYVANSSSGVADVTLNIGDTLTVYSGGDASGITVMGGVVEVDVGGVLGATAVGLYGAVTDYGTADDIDVSSGGFVYLIGPTNGTTIQTGASVTFDGPTAGTVVESGGYAIYAQGSTDDSTFPVSGGHVIHEFVSAGQTFLFDTAIGLGQEVRGDAISTTLVSGGGQFVDSGGFASATRVFSGAGQTVASGGSGSATIVYSGGNASASSGGVLDLTAVLNGGSVYVTGGTALATFVSGGGGLEVDAGIASGTVVLAGGRDDVVSAGQDYYADVASGGILTVSSGGVSYNANLSAGAILVAEDGGVVNGLVVASGATAILGTDTGLDNFSYVSGAVSAVGSVVSGVFTEIYNLGGGLVGKFVSSGHVEDFYISGTLETETVQTGDSYITTNEINGYATSGTFVPETAPALGQGITVASGGLVILAGGVLSGGGNHIAAGATIQIGGSGTDIFIDGGTETINFAGSFFSQTLAASGATLLVGNGGVAISGYVASGAIEHIASGGSALANGVLDSAELYVAAGGYVSGGYVSAGSAYVSGSAVNLELLGNVTAADFPLSAPYKDFGIVSVASGGYTSGLLIGSGGLEIVSSGGTAISGVASSGDMILAGGTASGTVVEDGSDSPYFIIPVLSITQSGLAMSSVISAGGLESLNSGGTSLFTSALSSGFEKVFAGGTSISGTVSGEGAFAFILGGTALNMMVDSSGTVRISGGGESISGTLQSGGQQQVSSGGLAVATTIADGAEEFVEAGGSSSGSLIASGGLQDVSGGTTISATIRAGGTALVAAGIAQAAKILSGGVLMLASGATPSAGTSASIIASGGFEVLYGGIASGSLIEAGGEQDLLSSGAVASNTVISAGATEFVFGGAAFSSTLRSGGVEFVSGGYTNVDIVAAGGTEKVLSGEATETSVAAGGTVLIGSGGSGLFGSISGLEFISTGGTSIGDIVQAGGSIIAYNGGLVRSTGIHFDGSLILRTGGTASAVAVQSAGTLYVSGGGTALFTDGEDGSIQLFAGAVASNTSLSFGQQYVVLGATAVSTTLSSPDSTALQTVLGDASGTIVNKGGQEVVSGGGISISAILSGQDPKLYNADPQLPDDGVQTVRAGGRAYNTQVLFGGVLIVDSGGIAIDPVIQKNGHLLEFNGTVINPLIYGVEEDGNGDPVSGAVIGSGGLFIVTPGGSASGTLVNSGGTLVAAGGALSATQQNAGGTVISSGIVILGSDGLVSSGLSTTNLIISAGQAEYVLSGGTAFGARINSGATLELAGGAATSGIIFAEGGGILNIDAALPITGISGFAAGDVIDLTTISGGFASLSGTLLTVTAGASTFTLNFDSAIAGHVIKASADASVLGTALAIACYAAGTQILTPRGPAPVEALRPGDSVLTVLPGGPMARAIIWTGHRRIDLTRHPDPAAIRPVLIRAGALGAGLPERDLRVSPHHGMFLEGALYEATALVNGVSIIRDEAAQTVTYHHIELAAHNIILAEGAPSETYLDTGNRDMFAEFHDGPVQRHAVFRTAENAPTCAPLIRDGAQADAMRARLSPPEIVGRISALWHAFA